MIELCKILNITIEDLLNGEIVNMNNHDEKKEKLLLEMVKQKEDNDRRLLRLEILIGIFSIIILLGFTFVASFVEMEAWIRIIIIISGFIPALIGIAFALKIEQIAGYYECKKCFLSNAYE